MEHAYRIFSDHKVLDDVGKVGRHKRARISLWFGHLTAFDYTLAYRKGSAKGNRPEFRIARHNLPPSTAAVGIVDSPQGAMGYISRPSLRPAHSLFPGSPYSGLGGLVPPPKNAVLDGLPFASLDFREFHEHGSHV